MSKSFNEYAALDERHLRYWKTSDAYWILFVGVVIGFAIGLYVGAGIGAKQERKVYERQEQSQKWPRA